MRQNNEKKHLILKILGALIILFLIFVAVKDFTPESTSVEKIVLYEDVK